MGDREAFRHAGCMPAMIWVLNTYEKYGKTVSYRRH